MTANYSLAALQAKMQYKFNDIKLLDQALTHKSYNNAQNKNNERLEFLGDAVLQIIVSEYLYQNFPELPEGNLAKIRALLVSQPTLADRARFFRLQQFLKVGKSEKHNRTSELDSLLCDAYEAVIGAIYLDSDLDTAKQFVLNNLPEWNQDELSMINAKSTLQEYSQQETKTVPTYRVIAEKGPDHDKQFEVEVWLSNKMLGKGIGKSKKEATQNAAREALNELNVES